MALLSTDYFSINRAGTPGDGTSGTYYVSTIADLTALLVNDLVPEIISADANNALVAGSDDKLFLRNVSISQNAGTGDITFTDNLGASSTVTTKDTNWMSNAAAP